MTAPAEVRLAGSSVDGGMRLAPQGADAEHLMDQAPVDPIWQRMPIGRRVEFPVAGGAELVADRPK